MDWVIRAETNEEMRRRYDLWAQHYDEDVGSYEDYLVPREAAKVARALLAPEARIFDAGAGTGLVGQAMAEVASKGAPFRMMPTTEPEFTCEIWVSNVL